jgi:hypothetical protein
MAGLGGILVAGTLNYMENTIWFLFKICKNNMGNKSFVCVVQGTRLGRVTP